MKREMGYIKIESYAKLDWVPSTFHRLGSCNIVSTFQADISDEFEVINKRTGKKENEKRIVAKKQTVILFSWDLEHTIGEFDRQYQGRGEYFKECIMSYCKLPNFTEHYNSNDDPRNPKNEEE